MTRPGPIFIRVIAVLAVVIVLPTEASAKTSTDPRQQRQAVRSQRASVVHKLDALTASAKEVARALDVLGSNVSGAQKDYQQSRRDAASANSAATDARAEEAAKQQQMLQKSASLKSLALRSYVDADSSVDGGMAALTGDSTDGLVRSGYSEVYAASFGVVLDEIRQRAQDLADLRTVAEKADALAKQRKSDEADQLKELKKRRNEQQVLANQLETRLENALAESAALSSIDRNLSDQIAQQDAALATRLGATSGGTPGRAGPTAAVGETELAAGIRVASSIASNVRNMVNAAAAAGYSLGGSGYRDPAVQIALRRSNCGSSNFAVYELPPSACHPPTARPGASMHERGLAIDFSCAGAVITSHSNGCYRWLANHAASYGFYNLASEPWHWSINGR